MKWRPSATIPAIEKRAELLRGIRDFFYENEFLEVQTPLLSRDTVVDRHLDPMVLPAKNLGLPNLEDSMADFYLQTSPEFAMKRLITHGLEAIFQICHAFRAAESGPMHNPEFCMLEWYRVGDDRQAGMKLLGELIKRVSPWKEVEELSYQEAFQLHADCDPLVDSDAALAECAMKRLGASSDFSKDRDDWLNLILADIVQPKLGLEKPVLLYHYPASQSALAKLSTDATGGKMNTAERFELFIGGIELANGYDELTDAQELRQRNRRVNQQRREDNNFELPEESRLLEAMAHGMPNSSGCALGVDRLLMVLMNANHIEDVLAFPIDRS
ncbi:MAG: elongation factor P--(R)-beta-lysine ligase [Planctomycetota bacterium]